MQQIPDVESVKKYYKHLIDGYEQINSYLSLNSNIKNPLKVIVEFSHDRDGSLLKINSKINDPNFIIMNISHVETICKLYKTNRKLFDILINKIFDAEYLLKHSYSIKQIFIDLKIPFSAIFDADKDYIANFVKELMTKNNVKSN